MLELPNDACTLFAGDAKYSIPSEWDGEHEIVSHCGWWIGIIKIVHIDGKRYMDWLKVYSLRF